MPGPRPRASRQAASAAADRTNFPRCRAELRADRLAPTGRLRARARCGPAPCGSSQAKSLETPRRVERETRVRSELQPVDRGVARLHLVADALNLGGDLT